MMKRTTLAMAVALQFLAAPVMAQGTSDKDANAHHYQGGPQTGVLHSTKHTKPSDANAKVRAPSGNVSPRPLRLQPRLAKEKDRTDRETNRRQIDHRRLPRHSGVHKPS